MYTFIMVHLYLVLHAVTRVADVPEITLPPPALCAVPGTKYSSSWREAAWAGPEVRKRHSLTGSF